MDILILNLLNEHSYHGYQISKILLDKMKMNIRAGKKELDKMNLHFDEIVKNIKSLRE